MTNGSTTGLVLGKFMPPHLGHCHLVDFARAYCDALTVLVCTLDREPIDGALRYRWMRRMFPDCQVVHVTDDLPQAPEESPDFWPIWRELVRRFVPGPIDFVFASEDYGTPLAAVLGASFVPVDRARELVPTSGTVIRADPMAHWDLLPVELRAYYARRVSIFGPESTGKSTMARRLARRFQTAWVHEYARGLLDRTGGVCAPEDIPMIARGQRAAEAAAVRRAERVLFCDTDPLLTAVWSEVLFGRSPPEVEAIARGQRYDLTLLLDVDVPWVDDEQRYFPDARARRDFFERCRIALDRAERSYLVVRGSWQEREEIAARAVEAMLKEPRRS